MKLGKVMKYIFFIFLFLFLGAYLIEKTGYYEYNLQRKKNLTTEQMNQFERDVAAGKKVDLNHYLESTTVDYSNSLTRSTVEISLKVNKCLKVFLTDGFKIFEKFIK